jgi:hypothetical protein
MAFIISSSGPARTTDLDARLRAAERARGAAARSGAAPASLRRRHDTRADWTEDGKRQRGRTQRGEWRTSDSQRGKWKEREVGAFYFFLLSVLQSAIIGFKGRGVTRN